MCWFRRKKKKSDFKFFVGKKGYNDKHPACVKQNKDSTYNALSMTHQSKSFGNQNIKLNKNPNKKDNRDSFVQPRVYIAEESNFKKGYELNWSNLDKKQANRLLKILDKTKKRPNDFRSKK